MPQEANIFQRVFQRGQSQQAKPQGAQRVEGSRQSEDQGNNATGSEDSGSELEGSQGSKPNRPSKKATSPLDDFSSLFETPDPNDPKAAKEDLPPSLSISADKLKAHVDKLDFTKDLPEEVMQGITNMGDQGKLMLSLLNHVGRQAYSTAVQHNSALTDKFVGMRSEYDGKSLSNRVKSELVRSGFHKSNSHPVVKAAQEMLAAQLQAKNPDATPEWIQEKTNSFFQLLGQQLSPNKEGTGDDGEPSSGSDVNWLEFAGVKPPSKAA